jgi:tetratricopeptide (TPR) repeat protein
MGRLPTSSQFSRISELVNQLKPVSGTEREAGLRALRDRGEDPIVLSFVEDRLRLPPEDLVGRKLGGFTLRKLIGAGGMGIAYLADQDMPRREVIVKVPHSVLVARNESLIRRFLEEIETLGRLEHIGIARIYEGGIHTDSPGTGGSSFPYFAMEYVRGARITVYQKEEAPELPELLNKFLQACAAVRYAHSLGIFHCDLKPEHILIDANGFPRVLDFGLARLLDPSLEREEQLFVAGSPPYMSPEQVNDEFGEIGPGTDVYALGIILFELLAGQRPYEVPAGIGEATRSAICGAKPARLAELNSSYQGDLEDIVACALQKNPRDRYKSVKDLEDALRSYLAHRKPCNLPLASIGRLFKGREAFLDELRTRLGAPDGRATAIVNKLAVHGLGGVGKTRAAVEYAWRHAGEYTALLFVSAPSAAELRDNLANLAGALGTTAKGTTVDEQLATVLRWLDSHPGWLMIIDNVDTDEAAHEVQRQLAKLAAGHVLITSRIANWSAEVVPLDLDVLAPADAVAFLMERTPHRRRQPGDAADAAAVARELDGLALALDQAAAFIHKEGLSFAEYLRRWEAKRLEVLRWHDSRQVQYPASVAVTWETTLAQLGEPERRLLNVLGWLAPEPIPLFLFEAAALAEFAGNPREALAGLAGYSLVRFDASGDAVLVHRLVQETIRSSLPEADRNMVLGVALSAVNGVAPSKASDVRTWAVWTPLAAHAAAVAHHADTIGLSLTTIRLMVPLANYWKARGQFRAAEPLYRRVLEIAERSFGPDHPEVAVGVANLAELLKSTNRLAEADPLLRRALESAERHCGPDSLAVAPFVNALAGLLRTTNRLAEAEPLYRRALAIRERSLAPDDPDTAVCLNDLAMLLESTNRPAEAEPLLRRALAINECSYDPDHPEVATTLNSLAVLLNSTNRLAEAEPLFRRALAIDENSYGPDHPKVATALNNLAELLKSTNRLAEAEPFHRRAVAIFEASLGPEHPNVATALLNLAGLLKSNNRLAEAEPLFRRALAIRETSLGPDDPDTATALNNLGLLLHSTDRPGEAEPLFRRALAMGETGLGPDHPDVAIRLGNLAVLLKDTDRPAEAEPLFRRALAIDECRYGPDHPRVARVLNDLAVLLMATGRPAEADPLFRRALAIDEHCYGPDHREVARVLNNLADLLRDSNRPDEAEPLYRRALAIAEPSYGPDHPDVATMLEGLANLLWATDRPGEAELLTRRALAIDERNFGSDHPDVARILHNLATHLWNTNRPSEAEPLCRRSLTIFERRYGPDHPHVAHVLNILAVRLAETARAGEAESLYRRAVAIIERNSGPDHPKVTAYLRNLVLLLWNSDRPGEADPLCRRALAIDEGTYGPDHPDVALDLFYLAALLAKMNRRGETEPLLRRALAIAERNCGSDFHVEYVLNNLAMLLYETNRLDEAEPFFRRALAIRERRHGPDHPDVALALRNLAALLRDSNRPGEAEPLVWRGLQILVEFQVRTGQEHPDLRDFTPHYRAVLEAMGKTAVQIERRLHELTHRLPPETVRSLSVYRNRFSAIDAMMRGVRLGLGQLSALFPFLRQPPA